VVTEEYLSALMLFGGTTLIICAHKRRSPGRRWIWYCPVAFLLLSLAQANNALWGFQMAWYLVLLMVALALFLLDQEPQTWLVFGGAAAAAVIASFSSLQGLLVWPAGLLLIYLRRRPRHLVLAWIGSAVLAGLLYFVGFNFNATQDRTNLTAVLTFFVRVVGDIVGDRNPGLWEALFGSVLVVTAIWVLVRFAVWARTSTRGRPFALSLILFGLLFSALTAYGRSSYYALGVKVEYRYTVFAIFVLVGLYLAVLDPPPVTSELRSPEPGAPSPTGSAGRPRRTRSDHLFTLARVVVGIGIVLTVIIGSANGISQARALRENRVYVGQVTVRANQYPDSFIEGLYFSQTVPFIRRAVTIARDDRLSLFDTGDAASYLSEKPFQFQLMPLRATVIIPRNGSTVHGKQLLDVLGSGSYDITRVDYNVSGPGRTSASLERGASTKYGWLAIWNTSSVPNGSYTIEATVDDSASRSVKTSPVEVHVENRPGS
jgi:hypothetical protein